MKFSTVIASSDGHRITVWDESRIYSASKLKKNTQQKAFHLAADKSKPDPLIMKRVAFDVDDGGYGVELLNHFGGLEKVATTLVSVGEKKFLFGTIIKLTKKNISISKRFVCVNLFTRSLLAECSISNSAGSFWQTSLDLSTTIY